jgi:hypothetical protein
VNCAPEDDIAAEEAREEGVVVALFAGRRGRAEDEHGRLVNEREETEVARVLSGSFEDEEGF